MYHFLQSSLPHVLWHSFHQLVVEHILQHASVSESEFFNSFVGIMDQRTFAWYLLCLCGGPATPSIITFALNDSIHYMNWGTGTKEKKEYSEIVLKSFLLFTSKFKGFHKAELKIDWKLCCSTNLLKKGFFNEAFEVNHSFNPITLNQTYLVFVYFSYIFRIV